MPSSLAAAGAQASAALGQAAGSAASAALGAVAGGGSAAAGGGDAAYDDLLRRLREEQEQLGQLIQHPF